jgi:hypothetical protein
MRSFKEERAKDLINNSVHIRGCKNKVARVERIIANSYGNSVLQELDKN